MDLNQEINQNQSSGKYWSKWPESYWTVEHYPRCFHKWSIITIPIFSKIWT